MVAALVGGYPPAGAFDRKVKACLTTRSSTRTPPSPSRCEPPSQSCGEILPAAWTPMASMPRRTSWRIASVAPPSWDGQRSVGIASSRRRSTSPSREDTCDSPTTGWRSPTGGSASSRTARAGVTGVTAGRRPWPPDLLSNQVPRDSLPAVPDRQL